MSRCRGRWLKPEAGGPTWSDDCESHPCWHCPGGESFCDEHLPRIGDRDSMYQRYIEAKLMAEGRLVRLTPVQELEVKP